ncbi:acetate--CoA ligase family protein [Mesorhizobium sp. CAU 1732]|uniref:acetate--CoA ligase family protein n=1 Tax=Mesorhizobium sp. CAU 1732 TaxID=3140358 RepID=UPI003260822E
MHIDVTSMVRPRSVAIVGASAKRVTQGNVVISNLKEWGYQGAVLPVHPQAREIDGLAACNTVAALPAETDLAIVAIPAAQVPAILNELEDSPVRSAIVFTNGFSSDEERAIREMSRSSRLIVHGPNCMGLVNFTDSIPLYPSRPSERLRAGKVAIVAQSGSAAISVMNSTVVGFSKVVTMGSEFHVGAADYIRWLAGDDATTTIGVVAESIKDPVAFALAAEAVHAAGKSLVVLKVGRTATGLAATQAHTGALVSDSDAYDDFFAATNIATAADYDELIASLECSAVARKMVGGSDIAIVGISGGQTALACDIAETGGIGVAAFSETTRQRVMKALPGTSGSNPIDFGATVNVDDRNSPEAIAAVFEDAAVGAVVALQDTQESLNPATLENYMGILTVYAEAGQAASKPLVVISPTSENVDPGVRAFLGKHDVPLIRGLTAGLRAAGNLRLGKPGIAGAWGNARRSDRPFHNPNAPRLREELLETTGTLSPETSFRILRDYGLPLVRAIVVGGVEDAVARASEIGFPMVVKVASRDIQHRSDAGGVVLDVTDEVGLRAAIARIATNVGKALPDAVIDGYELQEQVVGGVEAMAGFTSAPPFGQLVVVGSGGTLVEVMADRAVKLAPFDTEAAVSMLSRTKLAKVLGGYRNLVPETDISPLADVAVKLSQMASDLEGVMVACDLNPVVLRHGSGEARIVDALCIVAAPA